jgi:putative peptidoglycan lipid II flippase
MLARGAAVITLATAVSRVTGFFRVLAVAAAMGTTFLASTYQTANTLPNMLFELVAAGVLTSVFVPTFVEHIVRDEQDEGWDAANAMASMALVGLVGLALILALGAPLLMRALTVAVENDALREQEIELGSDLLRLFTPQIVFYGLGMIMTSALHAHNRFGAPAVAPIFNNIVVIGVYLAYAAMRGSEPPSVEGISTSEIWLLGAGTTAGVVAMTLCLVPRLRSLGWRARWRWDPRHPAVLRARRLGIWALGYAGGYQAGLIVVLILANKIAGGVAAYQWAYTFFYMPHALFAVPIFNVLFTALSEHAVRQETGALSDRLRNGLKMLGFILLPVAAFLAAVPEPLTELTLRYGVMTPEGGRLVAGVIRAFAIGLPTYSAFLVLTRAFYAIGDTRIPALVNLAGVAVAGALGAVLFWELPDVWKVPGLALGHSAGFAIAAVVLFRMFERRGPKVGDKTLWRSLARSALLAAIAFGAMAMVTAALSTGSKGDALVNLLASSVAGAVVYLGGMRFLRAPELTRLTLLLRGSRR